VQIDEDQLDYDAETHTFTLAHTGGRYARDDEEVLAGKMAELLGEFPDGLNGSQIEEKLRERSVKIKGKGIVNKVAANATKVFVAMPGKIPSEKRWGLRTDAPGPEDKTSAGVRPKGRRRGRVEVTDIQIVKSPTLLSAEEQERIREMNRLADARYERDQE